MDKCINIVIFGQSKLLSPQIWSLHIAKAWLYIFKTLVYTLSRLTVSYWEPYPRPLPSPPSPSHHLHLQLGSLKPKHLRLVLMLKQYIVNYSLSECVNSYRTWYIFLIINVFITGVWVVVAAA